MHKHTVPCLFLALITAIKSGSVFWYRVPSALYCSMPTAAWWREETVRCTALFTDI